MPALKIILDGDGAWPDLAARPDDIIHLGDDTPIEVCVLPAGMTSGKPSVAFRFDLPGGKVVIAETSWALLATTARGIAARYGWPE